MKSSETNAWTTPLPAVKNASDSVESTEDAVERAFGYPNEIYVVIGILCFLSVMGTTGNFLVLYVFSKRKDKLVSTLFILVLAVVDFSTCTIVIPYTIYMEYKEFMIDLDIVCKIYQFLITSNIPFSTLIMVAIAIDRYFCICHPFLHALNIQRAKIMSACMGVFAAMLGVVVALMYGITYRTHLPELTTVGTVEQRNTTGPLETDNIAVGHLVENSLYNAESTQSATWTRETPEESDVFPHCDTSFDILSKAFLDYYRKLYSALYLVSLIIVVILYALIYHSVLAHRTKREKLKGRGAPMVQLSSPTMDNHTDNTENTLLTVDGNDVTGEAKAQMRGNSTKKEQRQLDRKKKKTSKKDNNRMANLKTAAMLFVVTVVFIVTFLPACLMALQYIPYNMTIFYMYFANNVANPIIYSFMNKTFRDDLKKLFCQQ